MKKKRKPHEASPKDQYYLETSIQIKRLLGHPSQKQLIESILVNSKKFSSLFIFREFKEALIVPLINFYFILREEASLSDAINVFSNVSRSTRDLKEILLFLSELIKNKEAIDNKDKALAIVYSYILQFYWLFEEIIDGYVANNSGFKTNKVDLEFTEDGFHKFTEDIRCVGQCGQEKFWIKQSAILDMFLDKNVNGKYGTHRDFKNHLSIFSEIKADYKRSDMKTRCLKLGDAVIALECPQYFTLLSFDSVFEIYCSILKKDYLIFPSLTGLKKGEKPRSNKPLVTQ